MFYRASLFLPALGLLAACATLDETQCRAGTWYEIGQTDGANGQLISHLSKHAEACAQYGIAPDQSAWLRGRADGLPLYCTPERAYSIGLSGKRLSPVCPATQQSALTRINRDGLRLHQIEDEIDDIEDEIDDITRALLTLDPENPAVPELIAERRVLRLDLLTLKSRRNLLRNRAPV